jgi:membrane-associated protease RseP (regulator of RpoE activity)
MAGPASPGDGRGFADVLVGGFEMSRRVVMIAGVLVVLLAAYIGIRLVVLNASAGDEPRRDVRAAALARVPGPGSDADRVVLTVEVPAWGEPLAPVGGSHGPGCPTTEVSALLGIVIGSPHGILVAGVRPDGPAAKGGIKQGDSIVECDGAAVTCPSNLLPLLERGEERRPVELTVLRRAKD